MNVPETDLLHQIVAQYSIGELIKYQKLTRGYVNTSYAIITTVAGESRKYLLRIYRQEVEEAEIIFEHSILKHLMKEGFDLSAAVLAAGNGMTYIRQPIDGQAEDAFCAIFEYLPGEDRFTWIRPQCNPGELAESAIALARFHDAVCGLTPDGQRVEPKIVDMLPQIEAGVKARLANRKPNPFEDCLAENEAAILSALDHLRGEIDLAEFNRTPHLVIHGDYHPGNLKFDGGRVVGLFDLDWSKVDARTFDLGLALTYFCASWDTEHPDEYFHLDRAAIFLRAYQTASAQMRNLGPLDAVEIRYLPGMCAAGNMYVLEWALRDYYGREVDPLEYLGFLQHHLCLMRWYEDAGHRRTLEQTIAENMCPVGATHT